VDVEEVAGPAGGIEDFGGGEPVLEGLEHSVGLAARLAALRGGELCGTAVPAVI